MMLARLGLEEDEDAFVELARAAVAESAPCVPFVEEVLRATYHRYLKTAHPTFFVVEQNRALIGFMKATISQYDFSDRIYTTQEVLYVHPAKRGTRAAALLMSNFCQWSDRLGAVESTGGNDNDLTSERTAKLLGRFGFSRVGFFVRRMRGA